MRLFPESNTFTPRGFLHRNIKPDNFLMCVGREGNLLYIVDSGLAKEFADAEWYKGLGNLPLGGTRRYASIRKEQFLGR